MKLVSINPVPLCKTCIYHKDGYCWHFMEEVGDDESCDAFIKNEMEDN